MNNIQPVIMAGGFGTRLWPLSGEINSKQFLKIFSGYSLFQLTLLRNRHIGKPIVIVNIIQQEIAQTQIEEIGCDADIIVEPLQKNTAPCAIIASIFAKNRKKTKVALLPADHYISDDIKYKISVAQAIAALHCHNICTIGIKPSKPHSGYGYIHVEDNKDNVRIAKSFIEKPSLEIAKILVEQPNYYWNSGMFFYDADFMLSMSDRFIPETLEMVENSINEKSCGLLAKDHYEKIAPISIDHSIIQNLSEMAFVEAGFDWLDIGNWDSLWKINKKDCNLNHIEGNVLASKVTNSFIKSDGPQTTVIGLSDVIVVSNGGNVLVAGRDKAEDLKNIGFKINSIGEAGNANNNPFDCKINKYVINQGDSLKINNAVSDQNWVVLKGKVKVVTNETIKKLDANSSIHITKSQNYHFHNLGESVACLVSIS